MSLYRKYRPLTFADVIGQDHVVTTLEQAAEQDKLTHAYLFAGNRGTGKTSVARILAKLIMTKGIKDETIKKQIIKGVEEGNIVDLLEVDAASNRGIDDIRDLVEKIQFSPVIATAKIYIIDEVHMLTKEAFNALLKTLEEPPPYAFFILATTELNKIPMTIQSRCQCFPFRNIRDDDIIRRLQFIVDNEKINVERDALRAIAQHVEGGMRDAISLLDQLRSLENITLEDVEQRIGSTGQEHIETIFEAIDANDTEALVETVKKIEEAGIPMDVFIRKLLSVIRLRIHTAIEEKKPTVELLRILDILLDAIRDTRSNPLPGLVLESALLSICSNETPSERPKLADEDKKEVKAKEPAKKEAKKETEPEKAEEVPQEEAEIKEDATVEAAELTLESIRDQWATIVSEVQPASVRMSLKDSSVAALDETTVTIEFTSSFHKDKVATVESCRAIEQIMEKIFKQSLKLECEIGKLSSAETAPKKDEVNLAEAAAEIF